MDTHGDPGRDGVEDVATEAESAGAGAPDHGQDLGQFEDGAACNHAESEHFRERKLEAFGRGEVEMVHEGGVTLLGTLATTLRQPAARRPGTPGRVAHTCPSKATAGSEMKSGRLCVTAFSGCS